MLQKCANPACTVPFRSLHEGKLFLAESFGNNSEDGADGSRRKLRKREHFWLCAACSLHFTLHFDSGNRMLTVPINRGSGRRPMAPTTPCPSTA